MPAGPGRPGRLRDRSVPGPPGAGAGQQCPHPQRPPGRHPLVLPLRRAPPPRARRPHRPRAGHPGQALPAGQGLLPDPAELEALLAAPDQGTWRGRRDHALLAVAAQTGLRVSELTGLRNRDIQLGTGAHVRCRGKGRKERSTPLTRKTVAVLKAWMRERGSGPGDPLFPARRGTRSPATPSRTWSPGTPPSPPRDVRRSGPSTDAHVLRPAVPWNSCAPGRLSVIALWLGHERPETTSRIYLHADMSIKERALACTTPLNTKPGRYRPSDQLLTFLDSL